MFDLLDGFLWGLDGQHTAPQVRLVGLRRRADLNGRLAVVLPKPPIDTLTDMDKRRKYKVRLMPRDSLPQKDAEGKYTELPGQDRSGAECITVYPQNMRPPEMLWLMERSTCNEAFDRMNLKFMSKHHYELVPGQPQPAAVEAAPAESEPGPPAAPGEGKKKRNRRKKKKGGGAGGEQAAAAESQQELHPVMRELEVRKVEMLVLWSGGELLIEHVEQHLIQLRERRGQLDAECAQLLKTQKLECGKLLLAKKRGANGRGAIQKAQGRIRGFKILAEKFNEDVWQYNQHEDWFRGWDAMRLLERHIVERVLRIVRDGGDKGENEDPDWQSFEELLAEMKAEGPIKLV